MGMDGKRMPGSGEGELMKPGRELDALVAEKMFGHAPESYDFNEAGDRHYMPEFSTCISAAWDVVSHTARQWAWSLETDITHDGSDLVRVQINTWKGDRVFHAEAESAPHAICLAALKAVGAL
jgi:hypothetical protein